MSTSSVAITQSSKVSIALMVVIIAAIMAVFAAAFDFKVWVTDEVQSVRSEQVSSARAIESAVIKMTMQMERLSSDVGEMKDAVVKQSARAMDVQDRLARIEPRLDLLERGRK